MRRDREEPLKEESAEAMLDQFLAIWCKANRLTSSEAEAISDAAVASSASKSGFDKKWWKTCLWSGAPSLKAPVGSTRIAARSWHLAASAINLSN